MKKYIRFVEVPFIGKTKRFRVVSISSGETLGRVSWYPAWRRYSFSPGSDTIWDAHCLKEIISFIKKLMDERKK